MDGYEIAYFVACIAIETFLNVVDVSKRPLVLILYQSPGAGCSKAV